MEGQLWRFLITSAVGPGYWAEERTDEDEGKLVKYESRQLGGFLVRGRQGDQVERCASAFEKS